MSKRKAISTEEAVEGILNFVNQADEMNSDDSDSEDLDEPHGDAGVYNNYCITFPSLVKRNLFTTFATDTW